MKTRLYKHTSRKSKSITAMQPAGCLRWMRAIRYISRLLPLAVILLLAACSQDEREQDGPPVVPAGRNVTLEVKIPGAKTPSTYGMTTDRENNVGQLTVLAYKYEDTSETEQLQQTVTASPGDITNDGKGNMRVSLSIPTGKYNRLVLIANADAQANSLTLGSGLSALQSLEYRHTTGEWDDYIPMSGEVVAANTNGLDIQLGVPKTFSNLQLVRMLARVDIRNEAHESFTLKEVSLYNMNRNGLIVANANYPASPAAPNLPAALLTAASPITYHYAALQSENAMNNRIYLFEAEKASTAPTGPRIILSGTYNSVDYYYPVDFTYSATATRGSFMPVVRNHQYIFTINRVSGPGFTSAADALASPEVFTNIDARLLVLDNDFTDVYYNASNFLAVNTTGVEILMGAAAYDSPMADNTITVLTDATSFTIGCYNSDGTLAEETRMKPNLAVYTGGSSVTAYLVANYSTTTPADEFEGYAIVRAGSLQSARIPVHKWYCGNNGIAVTRNIGNSKYKTHRYPTGADGAMECWMVENSMEGAYSGKGYGLDASGNSIGSISIGTRGSVNGYYYTWAQAATTTPVASRPCPTGWSLPTPVQWRALQTTASTDSNNTGKWFTGSLGAANNAFAGYGGNSGTEWDRWGSEGRWWTSSQNERVFSDISNMYVSYSPSSSSWFSVRCVQDK